MYAELDVFTQPLYHVHVVTQMTHFKKANNTKVCQLAGGKDVYMPFKKNIRFWGGVSIILVHCFMSRVS